MDTWRERTSVTPPEPMDGARLALYDRAAMLRSRSHAALAGVAVPMAAAVGFLRSLSFTAAGCTLFLNACHVSGTTTCASDQNVLGAVCEETHECIGLV